MNIQWTWSEYLGDLKDQQIGTSRFSMESGDMTGHENEHPLLWVQHALFQMANCDWYDWYVTTVEAQEVSKESKLR